MKEILLIHHRLPYPTFSGMDKARFALIKILNQEYRVTLMVLNRAEINEIDIYAVKNICSELIIINEKHNLLFGYSIFKKIRTLFLICRSVLFFNPQFVSNDYSRKFKSKINKLLKSKAFDLIQPLSDYSLNYAIGLDGNIIKLFGPNDDMVGMTNSILSFTRNKLKRLFLKIELRARKKWQKKMIDYSHKSCYFSQKDIKNILKRNAELTSKLVWMPGAIEYEDEWNIKSIMQTEKNTLVFTGGLVSDFNRQSLVYFFTNIWPIIVNEIKDAKFYVVGQTQGHAFQKKYAYPNVYYTGKVNSVHPWLTKAAVFVNPSISGTGIKTKMVEALRFGKPIVTTPDGTSGLWHIPKDTMMVKQDPKSFADEIIRLLSDNDLLIRLSLKSRKLYEDYYSFKKLSSKIIDVYNNQILQ